MLDGFAGVSRAFAAVIIFERDHLLNVLPPEPIPCHTCHTLTAWSLGAIAFGARALPTTLTLRADELVFVLRIPELRPDVEGLFFHR